MKRWTNRPSDPLPALVPGPYGYRVWQDGGEWLWEVIRLEDGMPVDYLPIYGESSKRAAERQAIVRANARTKIDREREIAQKAREAAPIVRPEGGRNG